MRDIDDGFRFECNSGGRHQEGTSAATENINHCDHFLGRGICYGANILQARRAADLAIVRATLGQRLEEDLGDQPTAFARQFVKSFIGVLGQSIGHSAHGFVVFEANGFAIATMRCPVIPRTHQRVLENGELVGVVTHVVHQAVDERFRDLAARDTDRSGDGEASLVARHPRN